MTHETKPGGIEEQTESTKLGILLLQRGDSFFMVYRTPENNNGATNLWGAPGGKMEDADDGNFWKTAMREGSEELLEGESIETAEHYEVRDHSHVAQVRVKVESDMNGKLIPIEAVAYLVPAEGYRNLYSREGESKWMTPDDIRNLKKRNLLTPATERSLEVLFGI